MLLFVDLSALMRPMNQYPNVIRESVSVTRMMADHLMIFFVFDMLLVVSEYFFD